MELSDNLCNNCRKIQENRQKNHDFISKLSHEVRNPLTLIYSSLQLLEIDCPQIAENTLWPQIMQDVTATIQLLKDISSLNRQPSAQFTSLAVPDFLNRAAASCSAMMQKRRITFTVECSPSLDNAFIYGDETGLREAITNLLINAADAVSPDDCSDNNPSATSSEYPFDNIRLFSKQNTCSGNICLSADLAENFVCIHVKDNGPGIPKEYLDTLFDPFVTHKVNGTGLGLNIVKNIAALHGGSITVTTDSERTHSFTDFCLQIPIHTSAAVSACADICAG